MRTFLKENPKRFPVMSFGITFLIMSAVFVPFLIYNDGLFIFLGDYNVQQIPFYKLAHEAVRNGEVFWNWKTDLGVNFIGSYSFYLLFSPFFWLTLPFPNDFVPYLMAPLLILKTACAALTSYLFISRFVKDKYYAVIGSILYACSGFMMFNIFFNHFHEVAVFFPLMLVALEELVENDRKGFFGLMVAINCMINYWFFIGEVVFVIIYVFTRIFTKGWNINFKKFCLLAFEAVAGLMISSFVLFPSIQAISDNPRTGIDSLLTGWLMWIYGYSQRLPAIISSIFFPPELPSQPNFFPEQGAKWSSMSAWLPLMSTCGVGAFMASKKENFIKRLMLISLFMASIPILNSAFVLFNDSYYARWFYMPILMMCVATAVALEERETTNWKAGIGWTAFITFFIAIAVGLSPIEKDGTLKMGLFNYDDRFWIYVFYSVISIAITTVLIYKIKGNLRFKRLTTGFLAILVVGFNIGYIVIGKDTPERDKWFIDVALGGKDQLTLPDDGFARSDLYKAMDNLGMFWGLPNIQAFHSIVPGSIMEFYPAVGIKRDVSSKPPTSNYVPLRSLLSVKWFFVATNEKEQNLMSGYTLYDTQLGYNIYENDNFIPMGFAYDYSFSEQTRKDMAGDLSVRYMMRAVQLDDEAMVRNSDIAPEDDVFSYDMVDDNNIQIAIDERKAMSANTFEVDKNGFTATSNLDKERLMFFSVPYDKGWSATVNGEPALVEKANIGFMAVRVPAGEAMIRFNFLPVGIKLGAILTLLGVVILGMYAYMAYKNKQYNNSSTMKIIDEVGLDENFQTDVTDNNDDKQEEFNSEN